MYVRPLAEMNGHWNAYCAFTKTVARRRGHSTAEFQKAFARIYLIVHGGPAVVVNASSEGSGCRRSRAATPGTIRYRSSR